MDELNDEKILSILQSYKEKRKYDKDYYHTKLKVSEDFKVKNRQRAKDWISLNKERHKKNCMKHNDTRALRNKLNYYRKLNEVDKFKNKFPQDWERVLQLNLPHTPYEKYTKQQSSSNSNSSPTHQQQEQEIL